MYLHLYKFKYLSSQITIFPCVYFRLCDRIIMVYIGMYLVLSRTYFPYTYVTPPYGICQTSNLNGKSKVSVTATVAEVAFDPCL